MTDYINIDTILSGSPALAASVAAAFTQADDELIALRNGNLYDNVFGIILGSDSFTLTSGNGLYQITSESGVTDNLQSINGTASAARILTLTAASGHTITVRHALGNIRTASGADLILTGDRTAMFWRSGSNWVEIGAPNTVATPVIDVLEVQFFS